MAAIRLFAVSYASVTVTTVTCSSTRRPSLRRKVRSMRAASSRLWVAISAATPDWRTRLNELLEHALGGGRVEIAGRLVGKEEPRPIGDGAGDGHALLLAAGKLRGAVIAALGNAERVEELARALLGFGSRQAKDELRQHDVLERREFRQEMVELIDEADLRAAHAGALAVAELDAIDAVDHHGAAIGAFEQSGDVQQRRLPRPRGPEQGNGLAGIKRGGRALEHFDDAGALGVSALQVLKVERRRLI